MIYRSRTSATERLHTEADVLEELGKLPTTLGSTYSKMFRKIILHPVSSRRLAMNTLRWIMWAQRPLSPDEMIAMISGSDGDTTGVSGVDKEIILRFCHNLVVWDSTQDVLRFAHLSVREFLENDPSMKDSHTLVAERCLSFLCSPNTQTQQNNRRSIYIDQNWSYHVRSCSQQVESQQLESSNISRLLREFLNQSPRPSDAYRQWATQGHRYVKGNSL